MDAGGHLCVVRAHEVCDVHAGVLALEPVEGDIDVDLEGIKGQRRLMWRKGRENLPGGCHRKLSLFDPTRPSTLLDPAMDEMSAEIRTFNIPIYLHRFNN